MIYILGFKKKKNTINKTSNARRANASLWIAAGAIPTKCFWRMCAGDPLWATVQLKVSSLMRSPTGAHPTDLCWVTQPASRSYTIRCEGPETWCLEGIHSLLMAIRRKMSFKWEANKLFSPWPPSASKVPTCTSRTYSTERKLPVKERSPPCQNAASTAFPLPVFQKMGFWCVQRKGFWGRKPPFFSIEPLLYCPGF